MPILWSAIWINSRVAAVQTFHQQALWIERSRGIGLRIVVSCPNNRPAVQAMRFLRPHVLQWKSFVIPLPLRAKVVRTIFDELREARAPKLEVLKFSCYDNLGRWKFRAFGGGAPELRELSIYCGRYQTPPSARLAKLRVHIESVGVSGVDVLAILSSVASSLEDCVLTTAEVPTLDKAISSFAVTLPKLRNLTLEYTLIYALTTTHSISFPALRFLSISCDSVRHNPPLLSFLLHLPELEVLILSRIRSFDCSILITCGPVLRNLTLYSSLPPLSTFRSTLKNMVEARRQKSAISEARDSLTEIRVAGFQIPPEELKWLEENVVDFSYIR